jgi:PPOX class probable F420-dependent enzyme
LPLKVECVLLGPMPATNRRDQIRMTDAEIVAFLEDNRTLQVATIGSDGWPHLVAMFYAVFEGQVGFWTYAKSQKVVNLKRDPRITVMAETGKAYAELKGVQIAGLARIVDDRDQVTAFGELMYPRYFGVLNDAAREGVAVMGAKRVVVFVEPKRVVSWDHAKLGGVY